ncbi:MAG: ABC transporter substrate-binding protein [Chloroflexota bacterium]
MRWQPVDSVAGRLMASRGVTADDVVSSFNRIIRAPAAWITTGQPQVSKSATIEKTGPWEVTLRTPVELMTAFVWLAQGAGFARLYPPEVAARYGDMADWRNAVGTGPYMLVDYVPGSQLLYKKNPIYWGKDPIGPGKGNQLPYADSLRELIIPDLSTAYAALRTGKLDLQMGAEKVDAQSLWKTAPRLEYQKYLAGPNLIAMRQDKADKPFKDIRVRQALMLATDFQTIKRDYYGGDAEIDVWPTNKNLVLYVSLDKMPAAVQELYKYNPDKAKQLLKEAGYPSGFKTLIVVQSVAQRIDELSIIKDQWAKVGVELVLDIKDPGTYSRLAIAGHPYEEMLYRNVGMAIAQSLMQASTRNPAIWNPSHVNDPAGSIPYLEDLFQQQDKLMFADMDKVIELGKEANRFAMEQAFVVPFPTPYTYAFWWPWLKNYYGQGTGFLRYSWVDQDLKKSMGY